MTDFVTPTERLDAFAPNKSLDVCEFCNEKANPFATMVVVAISFVLGMFSLAAIKACDRAPEPVAVTSACPSCHYVSRHSKMAAYFKRSGHPADPSRMATAVLSTGHPKLLAAIAVTEKSPITSKRGGYKERHIGSWQMSRLNEKAYGKTPSDPLGQAMQADRLLKDLLAEYPVKVALSKYGGDSSSKYQRKVLAELERTP